MREDLVVVVVPSFGHSEFFHDFVGTVVSCVIIISPITHLEHLSLSCIHGSQMDMPVETLLGPGWRRLSKGLVHHDRTPRG